MIDLQFVYRGGTISIVSPSEHDEIARSIAQQSTFYEFDVLERCEHYLRRLHKNPELIVDVGAFIGNHTVFFAKVCDAKEVIAFEACRSSFQVLEETIRRNDLTNVRACNVAVGSKYGWATTRIPNADNLGANRIERCEADEPGAIPVTSLDTFLESIGRGSANVALLKIDVEGMECDVIRGARRTLAESKPVVCIEILDADHMRDFLRIVRGLSYLIRECNGAAPTYLATWESRLPQFLTRLVNFGWFVLARYGNNAWRWRYRRIIEILFPVQ